MGVPRERTHLLAHDMAGAKSLQRAVRVKQTKPLQGKRKTMRDPLCYETHRSCKDPLVTMSGLLQPQAIMDQ